MVWSTIKKKPLRKNSINFSCMICKRIHRRSKKGSIDLSIYKTYKKYEVCCACNFMIEHNFVFSELKSLLKAIILLPISNYLNIYRLKADLNQYLSIKNFFKI